MVKTPGSIGIGRLYVYAPESRRVFDVLFTRLARFGLCSRPMRKSPLSCVERKEGLRFVSTEGGGSGGRTGEASRGESVAVHVPVQKLVFPALEQSGVKRVEQRVLAGFLYLHVDVSFVKRVAAGPEHVFM